MSSSPNYNISFNFRATWRSRIRRNNFSEREYIRALKEEEIGGYSSLRMANTVKKLPKTGADSTDVHGRINERQGEPRMRILAWMSNCRISRKFRENFAMTLANPEKIDGAGGHFVARFNKISTSAIYHSLK